MGNLMIKIKLLSASGRALLFSGQQKSASWQMLFYFTCSDNRSIKKASFHI
ncbi:hypothetical protein BSG1_13426 [Bacillus sp. SG-1]|nr:hypothetical protein BSG1_13426 [Bacillus sp. SG-1]